MTDEQSYGDKPNPLRDQFETWAEGKYWLGKNRGVGYIHSETKAAWEAWQAAIRATPAHQQPSDKEIDALAHEHRIFVTKGQETIFHSLNTLKKIRAFARALLQNAASLKGPK